MAYCGPRGIPLSQFLKWHPDDQAAALAWQVEDAGRCRGCGTHEWEWEENHHAYRAEAFVCLGCHRLVTEERNNRRNAEVMPGLVVRLVRDEGG